MLRVKLRDLTTENMTGFPMDLTTAITTAKETLKVIPKAIPTDLKKD